MFLHVEYTQSRTDTESI